MADQQDPPVRGRPGRKPKRQGSKATSPNSTNGAKETRAGSAASARSSKSSGSGSGSGSGASANGGVPPSSSPLSHLNELEERVNDLGESWETESVFEDVLEDLTVDNPASLTDEPDACTAEEATRYRQELRAIGPEEFCNRTVGAGLITAKKMLTAFGVRPPSFLEGEPDDSYFGLLSLALSRELLKRAKLTRYNSIDDAVQLLQNARNIVVLTGAGISTSLGIPDFRSKNTGLYARLGHLGLSDPQEVFDIHVFREDPSIFYSVARDILPSTDRFTPTHAFIAMLQQKGKLLTNYSQNIDNLEAKAGIKPSKLIQCHGSFATASCVVCGYKVEGETIFPTIRAGGIPRCPRCAPKARTTLNSRKRKAPSSQGGREAPEVRDSESRRRSGSLSRASTSSDNATPAASETGGSNTSNTNTTNTATNSPAPAQAPRRGRPRGSRGRGGGRPVGRPRKTRQSASSSEGDAEDDSIANDDAALASTDIPSNGGVMKPDITFFGEPLPDEFSTRLTEHDRDLVDLVVVIGTSLKVAPVSEVVPFMPPHVPQIYISRTPVHHINFDIDLLGDCDVVVAELCRRLGWNLQHEMIPKGQVVEIETLPSGCGSQHVFKDVTPGLAKPDEENEKEDTSMGESEKEESKKEDEPKEEDQSKTEVKSEVESEVKTEVKTETNGVSHVETTVNGNAAGSAEPASTVASEGQTAEMAVRPTNGL